MLKKTNEILKNQKKLNKSLRSINGNKFIRKTITLLKTFQ